MYGSGGGEWLSFIIVLEELSRVDCAVADSPLMANFDAKVLKIVEGTSEIQRTIISRELLAQ